ncbi:hypothetical protein MRX96_019439 [Rhipicephalus microplus]
MAVSSLDERRVSPKGRLLTSGDDAICSRNLRASCVNHEMKEVKGVGRYTRALNGSQVGDAPTAYTALIYKLASHRRCGVASFDLGTGTSRRIDWPAIRKATHQVERSNCICRALRSWRCPNEWRAN